MRHVLVVANKTLHGDPLLEAVRAKSESEPCDFWIVVPATPVHDRTPRASATSYGGGIDLLEYDVHEDDKAYAAAEQRLQHGLERLRKLGVPVDGEVGDPDPMDAIADVVARRPVDEIMISTLPVHLSHWLHVDLPRRVAHKHHLPVSTISHSHLPAHT